MSVWVSRFELFQRFFLRLSSLTCNQELKVGNQWVYTKDPYIWKMNWVSKMWACFFLKILENDTMVLLILWYIEGIISIIWRIKNMFYNVYGVYAIEYFKHDFLSVELMIVFSGIQIHCELKLCCNSTIQIYPDKQQIEWCPNLVILMRFYSSFTFSCWKFLANNTTECLDFYVYLPQFNYSLLLPILVYLLFVVNSKQSITLSWNTLNTFGEPTLGPLQKKKRRWYHDRTQFFLKIIAVFQCYYN